MASRDANDSIDTLVNRLCTENISSVLGYLPRISDNAIKTSYIHPNSSSNRADTNKYA